MCEPERVDEHGVAHDLDLWREYKGRHEGRKSGMLNEQRIRQLDAKADKWLSVREQNQGSGSGSVTELPVAVELDEAA